MNGCLSTLIIDSLFDEMKVEFSDIDSERRLLMKFNNLQQFGSVQNYISEFRLLKLNLGKKAVSESGALYNFVRGLKPHIQ